MGYFDGMKVMLGRGMNAADRKSQELRLQAELSKIDASFESAYAALGKASYSHPNLSSLLQREYPDEYNAVSALLQQEQDLRGRIEELQRRAMVIAPSSLSQTQHFRCAKCGAHVTLDLAYCPSCGDNLSELKSQFRICPNCGTYHPADSVFCMHCGTKTIEIPVASVLQHSNAEGSSTDGGALDAGPYIRDVSQMTVAPAGNANAEVVVMPFQDVAPTSDNPTCPNCGAVVGIDDMFCGECGTRLIG